MTGRPGVAVGEGKKEERGRGGDGLRCWAYARTHGREKAREEDGLGPAGGPSNFFCTKRFSLFQKKKQTTKSFKQKPQMGSN